MSEHWHVDEPPAAAAGVAGEPAVAARLQAVLVVEGAVLSVQPDGVLRHPPNIIR